MKTRNASAVWLEKYNRWQIKVTNEYGVRKAIRLQQQYIAAGVSFTQETTLSGHRPLRMIREAKESGYYVRLFYVGISTAEEALKRIANRAQRAGMTFPAKMFCVGSKSALPPCRQFWTMWTRPFCMTTRKVSVPSRSIGTASCCVLAKLPHGYWSYNNDTKIRGQVQHVVQKM